MVLCKLLGHLGGLSGQENGLRQLSIFKSIVGSILTVWFSARHSTSWGVSFSIFITEETLGPFKDSSEQ